MAFLAFLLGLSVGLILYVWQQITVDRRFKSLLAEMAANDTPVAATLRLMLAILQGKSLASGGRDPAVLLTDQELRRQQDIWQQIVYSAPMGYLRLDEENYIVACSPQACQLLSIDPGQIVRPRSLLQLVRSYELDELVERARITQMPCQQDWTLHPASPDPVELTESQSYAVRGHALPLPDDHVVVFLENRQEAIALAQQRDRWASDVAHELKTPLTSIRLVAETLQMRLQPPLRDWIDRLLSEVIRLSNLVQDLLDLGQLQQGATYSLNRSSFDLVEVLFSAWMGLEPLASAKGLDIDYSGPTSLMLQADQTRIYRVLINLLDNGIKYSPPGAMIQVRVMVQSDPSDPSDLRSDKVCLDIIDSGCGFADVDLPHIFERFYRADPSRARGIPTYFNPSPVSDPARYSVLQAKTLGRMETPAADVTPSNPSQRYLSNDSDSVHRNVHPHPTHSVGLGLAIVKQIVQAHQGTVTACNHPETGGAWLRVTLPV